MELNWSRWFRCESSFGLLLVPHQPGIYALAEETISPATPNSKRVLAIFEINDAEDVSRALSRLFAPASPWSTRLNEANCFLRYAIVPDAEERRAATATLKNWLSSQFEAAARIFEPAGATAGLRVPERSELTVAERAVDRVMKERERGPARMTFP